MEASTSRLLTALTRSATSVVFRKTHRLPRCHLCQTPLILLQNAQTAGRAAFSTAAGRRYVLSASTADTMVSIRPECELYNLSGKTRRLILNNEATAKKMVECMALNHKDKVVVIDMYAGKGLLSRSLLQHPNVASVIALEPNKEYFASLQTLVESSAGRLHHIALDPFWWDTYSIIRKKGLLNSVRRSQWSDSNTNLALAGVIPDSINGERLLIQQFMCTVEQTWLYDYGCFDAYFLVSTKYKEKITAKPTTKQRHKLSVMLDACVDITELLAPSAFLPLNDHVDLKKMANRAKSFSYIKASPKMLERPMTQEEMDVLEFLARNLFVHTSKPWSASLKYLAAGADIIMKKLEENGDYVDPGKRPADLEAGDWAAIVRGFLRWPFRPKDLDQSDIKDEYIEASSGAREK